MLEEAWKAEVAKRGSKASLVRSLFAVWWVQFCIAGLLHGLNVASTLVGPVLLRVILSYLEDPDAPKSTGVVAAGLLVVTQVLLTAGSCHFNWKMSRLGIQSRGACSIMVHDKAMRLDLRALQQMDE